MPKSFIRCTPTLLVLVASWLGLAKSVHADDARAALPADPTLSALIRESLASVPELSSAQGAVRAVNERVARANTWPDPMLQVAVQNMGFTSIEIGRDPMSFVSVMASQAVPWPGKLDLRKQVALLSTAQAKQGVVRTRLTVEAEVRRQYLELLLVRERLELLQRLEVLWERSSGAARARYEAGAGAQSDFLRAQLEMSRLRQRRVALTAEESTRVSALNRMRGHPLTEPIPTPTHVRELPKPKSLETVFDSRSIAERSPELASAKLGVEQATRQVALAEREYFPDMNVGASVMVRGALPPMWTLSLAGPLPVFADSNQSSLVAENTQRVGVVRDQARGIEQVLRLRSEERHTVFRALLETIDLYEQGLLVQSRATMDSSLNQYQVGAVAFASVLEANAGYIADEEGYLQTLAAAHRILIAEVELSFSPVAMPSVLLSAPSGMSAATPSATADSTQGGFTSSGGM